MKVGAIILIAVAAIVALAGLFVWRVVPPTVGSAVGSAGHVSSDRAVAAGLAFEAVAPAIEGRATANDYLDGNELELRRALGLAQPELDVFLDAVELLSRSSPEERTRYWILTGVSLSKIRNCINHACAAAVLARRDGDPLMSRKYLRLAEIYRRLIPTRSEFEAGVAQGMRGVIENARLEVEREAWSSR